MPQRSTLPVAPPPAQATGRSAAAHVRAAVARPSAQHREAAQPRPDPGTAARPSQAAHVQAALTQAKHKSLPHLASALPPSAASAVQGRFAGAPKPPVIRPAPRLHHGAASTTVQRAAVDEMKQTESSQSTYLTATVVNTQGIRELASNLASTAAGHSEDRLIDQTLPAAAAAGHLEAKSNNQLWIGINRSPCSSTDRAGNGEVTCGKAGGAPGCAERLIHVAQNGFTHMGTTYPMTIHLAFRQIYGDNSAKQANSVLANEAMTTAGIAVSTQQIAGPSTKFQATSAMKSL
jgi:hypothetical protein